MLWIERLVEVYGDSELLMRVGSRRWLAALG